VDVDRSMAVAYASRRDWVWAFPADQAQILSKRENMNSIDQSLLKKRFALRKTRYISERFEKSPNITEQCAVSDCLHISYAAQDEAVLPLISTSFLQAYQYVKDWFGFDSDMAFGLWMAPHVKDLQYMTCQPHDEGFFCAPGSRDNRNIILFVSPLSCRVNADKDRLTGVFAHEITHHVVRDISGATVLSMTRKEKRDVPLWLEEGLCQVINSEIYPPLRQSCAERIDGAAKWYDREELWNDLSSCEEVNTAYLQAYKETKSLLAAKGRTEIIRLLYRNRTGETDWTALDAGVCGDETERQGA